MVSTFHGLEMARKALFAQQIALSTTGHNISNANTQGYSRQIVNFTPSSPIEYPTLHGTGALAGQLGTGVRVESIKRVREAFLDAQYRNDNQALHNWNIQKDTLEKIELLMNEPDDLGLRSVVDNFWNAWQELSREPETAGAVVKEVTQTMLQAFQFTDTKLSELKDDLQYNQEISILEANSFIDQIANLNKEIKRIENLGQDANDLRDQRDLIVDQLSNIMGIQVKEQMDGTYTVGLSNGATLVEGNEVTHLGDDVGQIALENISGGKFEGIQASMALVEEYQAHLETMLMGIAFGEVQVTIPAGSQLAKDVTYLDADGNEQTLEALTVVPEPGIKVTVQGISELHELGWTRNVEDGDAVGGVPFFLLNEDEDLSPLQRLQLNPDIVANEKNIAASFRVEMVDGQRKVVVGNGDLALSIAQLRNHSFVFDDSLPSVQGEKTFDEYYNSMIAELGVRTRETVRQATHQQLIVNTTDNRRLSVSGVSLDEEMANLIKFQHAYNAAARFVTLTDEMLDTIINRMIR